MTDSSQISQTAATAESSQTAATPVSQMAATLVSDSFPAPSHVPHTRTSLAIVEMLKNLPLVSILQMNGS